MKLVDGEEQPEPDMLGVLMNALWFWVGVGDG